MALVLLPVFLQTEDEFFLQSEDETYLYLDDFEQLYGVDMANIITTPRFYKNKLVLLALESTYGSDASPTAAANWIEARNLQVTPFELTLADRNIDLPYKGKSQQILAKVGAKVSFDIGLATSGTAGVAPKWGVLAKIAGWSETIIATTSVTYNLVSTGESSGSMYVNMDGVLHKMLGMRGSLKVKADAEGIPVLQFEGMALFTSPTEAAITAPTTSGWTIEQAVNCANTTGKINSVPIAWRNYEMNQGNEMTHLCLPGPQAEVIIKDRAPKGTLTMLAPTLTVFDPFTTARNGTLVPVEIVQGKTPGSTITVRTTSAIVGAEYTDIDGMIGYTLNLDHVPQNAGNNEASITLT